jgi:hypothetical protein
MLKFIKSRVLTALVVGAISVPALAVESVSDYPNNYAMVGDILVARPMGLVWTVLGSAAFVVSLPFTAIAGNVKESADVLVVGPAKETFVRCLGCINSGRNTNSNGSR